MANDQFSNLDLHENNQGRMGKLYYYEDKKEVKLDFSTKSELTWFIENVFSKYSLLTQHQSTRYENIKKGLLEKKK